MIADNLLGPSSSKGLRSRSRRIGWFQEDVKTTKVDSNEAKMTLRKAKTLNHRDTKVHEDSVAPSFLGR